MQKVADSNQVNVVLTDNYATQCNLQTFDTITSMTALLMQAANYRQRAQSDS